MFTVALFTMAKIWEQPKCPSTDEWAKKMWHIKCIYIHMIYTYRQWNITQSLKRMNNAICSNRGGPGNYHTNYMTSIQKLYGLYAESERNGTNELIY